MPSSLPVWFSIYIYIYFPIYTFDVLSCLPVIYHQPLSLLACMSVSSCIHFPFTVIIFYRKPPSSTRMTTEKWDDGRRHKDGEKDATKKNLVPCVRQITLENVLNVIFPRPLFTRPRDGNIPKSPWDASYCFIVFSFLKIWTSTLRHGCQCC